MSLNIDISYEVREGKDQYWKRHMRKQNTIICFKECPIKMDHCLLLYNNLLYLRFRFSWKKLFCLNLRSKHLICTKKKFIYIMELYCLQLQIIEIKFPYDRRLWVIVIQVNTSSRCWQNEYFYMLLKLPRVFPETFI